MKHNFSVMIIGNFGLWMTWYLGNRTNKNLWCAVKSCHTGLQFLIFDICFAHITEAYIWICWLVVLTFCSNQNSLAEIIDFWSPILIRDFSGLLNCKCQPFTAAHGTFVFVSIHQNICMFILFLLPTPPPQPNICFF